MVDRGVEVDSSTRLEAIIGVGHRQARYDTSVPGFFIPTTSLFAAGADSNPPPGTLDLIF